MNRLSAESSHYLRQHANNPVDWYPWGPEALARAKELDRPNFLSVYVVGDTTVRGTFVRNSEIVARLAAKQGHSLRSRSVRDLPQDRRYLPPPGPSHRASDFDSRMRQEVILVLDKGHAGFSLNRGDPFTL